MNKSIPLFVVLSLTTLIVVAQKQTKPYQEWSEKEVDKLLDNSPWAKTQIETDTSEMFYKPDGVSARGPVTSEQRAANGANNQAVSTNYRIRFLTARPVREALARKILLAQKTPNPDLAIQLSNFVEATSSNYIVVSVDFDTKDARQRNIPAQAFAAAVLATLKSRTYLDRNDGKRVFLLDYRAPSGDNLGAKFIFPRFVDEKPFLTTDFTQVRFYSEISSRVKLDVRFKIADMQYNGNLEY
jgi:hypothetical protein